MQGRMFSGFVRANSSSVKVETFQYFTRCITRCTSDHNEFDEISITHRVINSDRDLYEELKAQDSLVKRAILLIKFKDILPEQASALLVLMNFSDMSHLDNKHKSIINMAQQVINEHCSHILEKPTRRLT